MKTRKVSRLSSVGLATVVLVCISGVQPAVADWDPSQPAKWYQLPDLANGMDVLATWNSPYHKILADDFLCTQTGPITDMHIWGSWLYDRVPRDATGAPMPPLFHLSIHADIPAGTGGIPYSQPGALLWSRDLVPTASRIYATAQERFFDPNQNAVIGTDTQVWQYNFLLSPTDAFVQKEGTIYWLDVQVMPQPPGDAVGPYAFGWKTSYQHWNDDAVFGDNFTFGGPPEGWRELRDPATGQSLDLAFVLTTIPEPSGVALVVLGVALLGMRRVA